MQYWGYKFEALSTINEPWAEVSRADIEDRDERIVSNKAQYCSVVETGLGGNSMIIGGEVDAVWDHKSTNPAEPTRWVELKTTLEFPDDRSPQYQRAVQTFERKLNRFWAQSFLLGVPKIIVGYRSRQGILTDVGEIETMRIPNMVKKGSRAWDGNVCVNFAASFLSFLKDTITSPGVWRIQREPNSPHIIVTRTTESGTGRILTPEFVAWRELLLAKSVALLLEKAG